MKDMNQNYHLLLTFKYNRKAQHTKQQRYKQIQIAEAVIIIQIMEFKRSRSASKLTPHSNNPLNKYRIGEMLGQGQFGKVYKAYMRDSKSSFKYQSIYAAKIIPLGKLKKNPKLKQLLTNEIEILGNLKHQNIIKFEQLFVWEQKVYMIYQFCEGGDLQDLLPLSQDRALQVFKPIIKACSYAEKNNVLHRDLKPANILFKNGQPRVADWGFSRYLKQQFTATSFVGSPAYMAPELLNGSEYTNKADVWSFGVMLYQSIFNQMPWPAKNMKDLLSRLNNIPLRFPTQIMPIFNNILRSCLEVDPEKRASFHKLQKFIEANCRNMKTEQNQNPQQNQNKFQLSQSQIKKCSYYLQFAKRVQKFSDMQINSLCLELILLNLNKIKRKNFKQLSFQRMMTPCLSQRRMSLTKRDHRSPKTQSKIMKNESIYETTQTQALLQKQIFLIEKIKQNISMRSNSSLKQSLYNQKAIIKQIIKKLIKSITISQKSCQMTKTNHKQLIETNCILEAIMFQELTEQAKNKKLSDKIRQMQQMGVPTLMRFVNHKILYINQHYCKN